jgi:probable addiction module antidote protein
MSRLSSAAVQDEFGRRDVVRIAKARWDEDAVWDFLACLEQGPADSRRLRTALGKIVRGRRGMRQLARQTGLSRNVVYYALSDWGGEPKFDTILKVMCAMGLKLHAERLPA